MADFVDVREEKHEFLLFVFFPNERPKWLRRPERESGVSLAATF
jgi:hypothetical protein